LKPSLPLGLISLQVSQAIAEDLGHGDISASLIPEDNRAQAKLVVREDAVLSGCLWFEQAFLQCDPAARVTWYAKDGKKLIKDQQVCEVSGNARALLSAERTAINFLQTLSATATTTAQYVSLLADSSIRLLDTRKTIPGLRLAQKYAVHCGGGLNHRHGLYDGLLIKENHIIAAGGIKQAIDCAKKTISHGLKVEVEVETLDEVNQALSAGADILLLDNMSIEMLKQAVLINQNVKHPAKLEVSGNVNKDYLSELKQIGIDFISVGALTKNISSIDFSLRFA